MKRPIIPDFRHPDKIPQDIRWQMRDFGCDMPIHIHTLRKHPDSFVYYRKFGLFPVNRGDHQFVMGMLYVWESGFLNPFDTTYQDLGIKYEYGLDPVGDFADRFIEELKGTCYLSSVSSRVYALEGNLNRREENFFEPINWLRRKR